MATDTQIGKVSSLTGTATAQSAEGEIRALSIDAPVFLDDTISTNTSSNLELVFEDGTLFAQSENSQVLLDVYVYDPDTSSGELLFNLAQGGIRAISGDIAKLNPEGFNVETPLSTVGIRGTGFFVILTPDGQVVGVEEMDPTHVVIVETQLGQMTISKAGDFVAVQLDGFLSDPSLFSPEFLQQVQELAPFQSDPSDDGPGDDGDLDGGGDEGENDIPQEVLDDLADALQHLQALGDSDDLQNALDALTGVVGDGEDPTDTAEELQAVLDALEQSLEGVSNAIANLADDILAGNTAQDILANLDLRTLELNTDGTAYQAQIEAMGYTLFTTSPGDTGNNIMLGSGASDMFDGNAGNDILFGAGGNDSVLNGLSGNDYIYGGTGNDLIIGGDGIDYLVGGDGNDTFRYGFVAQRGDTIRDFTSGQDKLDFQNSEFNAGGNHGFMIFSSATTAWNGGQSQLNGYTTTFYDQDTGNVYHDADGSFGVSSPLLITHLEGNPTLALADMQLY